MILPLKCSGTHAVDESVIFEFSRGGPTLWFLGMLPLELRRHSIDSIHLFEVVVFRKPFSAFGLPGWSDFIGWVGFPRSCFTSNGSPRHCLFLTAGFRFGKVHISWLLFCGDRFPCGCVHQPAEVYIFQLRWELDAASDSEFPLILLLGFPWAVSIAGLLDAIGLFADEELIGTWEDKVIAIDFDFATILSSPFCPFSSCILFAVVLGQLIKPEFLAQQVELTWLMLNKWRRLFHSSRVKLPLVKMSASWCLVSMYPIWN